jgi:phosphoribosylpyrophosphate synthetase
MLALIGALRKKRPAEINLVVAHGLFTAPARDIFTRLYKQGKIKRVIVSDTVHIPYKKSPSEFIPNLEVVSTVKKSAKILHNIITNRPMSSFLDIFNAEKYFAEKG